MNKMAMTLVMKDYDYIAPLVYGEVVAEGIDLNLDRVSGMARGLADLTIEASELSFSRHLIRLSQDDQSFVGIPFFAYRAFRQRCFFVRRDSGLQDLQALAGKRIGTNGWPDTGNTWTRAALREQGVRIDRIAWWVGPVDDPSKAAQGHRPQPDLPPNVRYAEPGRTLRDMLLEGELDALMCPWPPKGFYDADSPIVRLIPDYRTAEREYYRRTGLYPGHHIVGVRREVFERDPWVAVSLYQALDRAMSLWQERRWKLAEMTPWLLAEIEESAGLMGRNWQPNGVEANRKMIQTLCEEEYAQRLAAAPLDAAEVFAEFEQAMKDA